MTHVPSSFEVETFTGRYVDMKRPRPETICLEDIAHSLSNICRYGGHSKFHYSVAQHAIFISERLRRQGHPKAVQLEGLHHDDPEGYLSDIPRPLKPLFGAAYVRLTKRMEAAIFEALGLGQWLSEPEEHHGIVKDADNWALFVEAKHLLPSQGINWAGSQLDDWGVRQDHLPSRIITPDYWMGRQDPAEVEAAFLARHKELTS